MKGWVHAGIALLAICIFSGCSAQPTPEAYGADLVITERADRASVEVGQNITLTITVSNHGPNPASGVLFGDSLPDALKVVSASCSGGSVSTRAFCEVDHLKSGQSAVATVVATPLLNPGQSEMKLTTKAMIAEFLAVDPNLKNNRTSVSVDIVMTAARKAP